MSDQHTGITAKTGQQCPATGLWLAPRTQLPPLRIKAGDIMPPHDGKAVTWQLIQQD